MSASNQQNAKNLLRQEQEEARQTAKDQSVRVRGGSAQEDEKEQEEQTKVEVWKYPSLITSAVFSGSL